MEINDDLLRYLEDLSRLSLTAEEESAVKKELSCFLNYMQVLDQADTEGFSEVSRPAESAGNVLREDRAAVSFAAAKESGSDALLQNAPAAQDHCFKVPKALE
ncbi:MAG: Asp-tRNA(Asn)/Glu-tRNA(Gln) amidotransferase subunit GatC [Firmicutes bacterium]|nr:Asp-tRNA(Asn)/Glu-tRNA(Gln) amidotransferase subunit GatC [Bacillota bacterium]